jgi:hypothetical protein
MPNDRVTDANSGTASASLDTFYTIQDRGRIMRFLEVNPHASDLLMAIPSAIRPYFPDDKLMLSVFSDPDDQQKYPQLEVAVRTQQEPREALQNLDNFDLDWWLDELEAHGGNIFLTVEFI